MKKLNDADILRALLERSGLSQRGAARQLGIAERTMRYYVSGEQPVPRALMLALESLTGDPAYYRRLEARIRAEAGCRCEDFKLTTFKSAEPGLQRVPAGFRTGTCKACSDGDTWEVAKRVLRISGVPVIGRKD
jgi:transcriptional regulator with XRE-family HTH domain